MSDALLSQIQEHIKLYEDRSEPWMADHQQAMRCRSVEEKVAFATFLFSRISHLDTVCHEEMFLKGAEFDPELEATLRMTYHKWHEAFAPIAQAIRELTSQGYTVDASEKFLKCLGEVKGVITPDDQFFGGEKLERLRNEAMRSHHEGRCEPFEDLAH